MNKSKSAQFIHIETYQSQKENKKKNHNSDVKETSAQGVLNEAKREKGFTSHIKAPEPPVLLYGVDLETLEGLVNNYKENAFIIDKKGNKKKLRSDASILLGGVVSLDREDIDQWDNYKKEAIEFLKLKYKDKLKTVIEHTDEAHPHFHFYVVADNNELLNNYHDGKNATLKAKKEKKGNQQLAYIQAMTKFQDDFYNSVASKYGFNRVGEKPRTRLSRSEYMALTKERLIKNQIIINKNDEINVLNNDLKNKKVLLDKVKEKGKKSGYDFAVNDFNNKNYVNKFIFSFSLNKEKIKNHDKVLNKNQKLTDQIILMEKRKNYYKNKYNNVLIQNEKLIIKNDLNKFLNFNFDEKKEENDNDISRRKEIDQQIKRFNEKINELEQRQQRIRAKYRNALSAFQRLRRGVFDNIKNTIDHFFKTRRDLSITRERSELEIKDTREIEKIITEKNKRGKLDQKRKLRI